MNHRIAAVQLNSSANIGTNLMTVQILLQQAVDQGAELLVLPENFAFMPKQAQDIVLIQEPFGAGRIQDFIAKWAQQLGVWIVAGSIPLVSNLDNKAVPACLVYDAQGKVVARYDKIHLFDVFLGSSGECYQESQYCQAGSQPCVVDSPVGKLGLSICYDVRFPELYRHLRAQGADILLVPAAFTAATGSAHWKTLLRARAIENQCYVLASGQCGLHESGRETYGHSMIVDPWGKVLACRDASVGIVLSEINLLQLQVLREEFPVWEHRRL